MKQGGKLKRIIQSMHFRVLIVLLLIGLAPVFLMKGGILNGFEEQTVSMRASMIRNQCSRLSADIIDAGYLQDGSSDVVDKELNQIADLYSGRVILVNSRYEIIRDTYLLDVGKTIIARELIECFQGKTTDYYNAENDFIEVVCPVTEETTKAVVGAFIVSIPTTDIIVARRNLSRDVLILEVVLIGLIIAASIYSSRLLVRPFRKVTAMMNSGGTDFLSDDISMPEYTETALLSEAYNQMRHRLQAQEESRQMFVSNVSHELKTPMTSMKVLSDSLIQQAEFGEVPNELYHEFMIDIGEEIDRENKIITDLLDLVKMDRNSPDIHIEDTNINDLIGLILKRLRPIAAKRGIEIALESYKPIIAQVDQTKFTLAVSNLVENGIKYNKENGWVHISLNVDSTYFFVKVQDSGIGIPLQDQEQIFERFYRVDKSHSREIGGTGLGLAITRQAVLMHHGAIRVYSREGEGTTFTVRIPLRYSEQEAEEV
ncbi:MAG TPA: two-component sensor histidine kinase [Lachnospiraceae bacterium]|nr:two-component sensor histidine kinase [Lachnospiraceae bacterium]